VMVTLTFAEDNKTMYGTTPQAAVVVLQSLGADAVGINCSMGPDKLTELVKAMAEVAEIPVVAKPNAGLPALKNGETVYDMEPSEFAVHMEQLLRAGASIIGGCCGSGAEHIAAVAEMAKRHGVTVISDEIHSPLTRPGTKYVPFASVSKTAREISITCVAASKAFNIAGLQSSALVVGDPHLRHKVWRGINTDEVGEPNVFSMRANIAAYRDSRDWLDELRVYLFENRDYAEAFIAEKLPKLHAVKADASYLLWLDISAYSNDSEAFAKDMREKCGLWVNDGAEYGKGGEGFLRINLASCRANVREGLKRLKMYIDSL